RPTRSTLLPYTTLFRSRTVNISTTASIILAAAGIPVVKHGNKAATSKSGASDVLVALGVKIDNSPEKVAKDFESLNLAFAYAPVDRKSTRLNSSHVKIS